VRKKGSGSLFFRQHQQAYFGAGAPAHGRVAPHSRTRADMERHAGNVVEPGAETLVHVRDQREEEEELPAVRVPGKLEVHAESRVFGGVSRAVRKQDGEVGGSGRQALVF